MDGFEVVGGCASGDRSIALRLSAPEIGSVRYNCYECMHREDLRNISIKVAESTGAF